MKSDWIIWIIYHCKFPSVLLASPIDRSFGCELSEMVSEMIFPCRLWVVSKLPAGEDLPKTFVEKLTGTHLHLSTQQKEYHSDSYLLETGLDCFKLIAGQFEVKAIAVEDCQVLAIASHRHSGQEKCSRYNHGLLENGLPDCINGVWRHAV